MIMNPTYAAQMRRPDAVFRRSGEAGPRPPAPGPQSPVPGPRSPALGPRPPAPSPRPPAPRPSAGTTCQCRTVDWPFRRVLTCSAIRLSAPPH
jgi:hypothetical protein